MAGFLSLITQQNTQRFLREHQYDDERQLVLKHKEINGIPSSMIAAQLSGRRKAKTKLPTWYNMDGIFYPPTINIEQCSSEATAIHKTAIIKENISSLGLAVDLTGGFGVDSYFLSKAFDAVHHVEPSVELLEIATHNHQQLGASNITHHCTTAEHFIDLNHLPFDLVFIDPSRRDEQSRRVHKLADCTPDITQLQSSLFAISNSILLKASPLLDIQQGLLEIKHVKKVIVVSVGNECKELLFLAEKDYDQEPMIEAVTLFENGSIKSSVSFTLKDERMANVSLGEPGLYLYEPNASVLKAGAFKWVSEKFGLTKLDANTHLYTSTKALADFPGKVFLVECLNPDAKQLKEFLPMGLANVVSRNYPLTTDEIKKKYRLRDGGSLYLIGFTSAKKKYLALCSRVTYT